MNEDLHLRITTRNGKIIGKIHLPSFNLDCPDSAVKLINTIKDLIKYCDQQQGGCQCPRTLRGVGLHLVECECSRVSEQRGHKWKPFGWSSSL